MYAVIFEVKINHLDEDYIATATRLRELAQKRYGCVDFLSLTEGEQEITISYWNDLDQILHWKQDAEHLKAQALGKAKWYKSYRVRVVEILRSYENEISFLND